MFRQNYVIKLKTESPFKFKIPSWSHVYDFWQKSQHFSKNFYELKNYFPGGSYHLYLKRLSIYDFLFRQKRNDVLGSLIGLAVLDAVLDGDDYPAIYDDYRYGGPQDKVNNYRKIVEKSLKKMIKIHKSILIFYRLMRNFIDFNLPHFSYMRREVICISKTS